MLNPSSVFARLRNITKVYRYQHLYFWMAYSLLYLFWVFVTDYKKYFTGKIGPMPIKMKLVDHISFWSFKIVHLALFVFLPIYTVGFAAWLVGFTGVQPCGRIRIKHRVSIGTHR